MFFETVKMNDLVKMSKYGIFYTIVYRQKMISLQALKSIKTV